MPAMSSKRIEQYIFSHKNCIRVPFIALAKRVFNTDEIRITNTFSRNGAYGTLSQKYSHEKSPSSQDCEMFRNLWMKIGAHRGSDQYEKDKKRWAKKAETIAKKAKKNREDI